MANRKKKEFCKRGHKLTDENTYQKYVGGTRDGRRCEDCRLVQRYGITVKERNDLLKSQDNRCAICKKKDGFTWGQGFNVVWHIDHKHDGTPNHRGIVCAKCNILLGHLGDDVQYIQSFVNYLRQWN